MTDRVDAGPRAARSDRNGADRPCPPSLCLVAPETGDPEGVIRALGARAVAGGWIDQDYVDAAVLREAQHPTGVPTAVSLAIPHAGTGRVHRGGFAAALLDPAVTFGQMGGAGATIDVRLVILLMVTDRTRQVALLGQLLGAVQEPGLADRLDTVTTPEDLSRIVSELVGG